MTGNVSRATVALAAALTLGACANPTSPTASGLTSRYDIIASVSQCQPMIDALRSSTQSIAIFGKNAEKDRIGLIGKLDAATADLDAGKLEDAIKKLNDYKTKVQSLGLVGKISSEDAASLVTSVDATIACISLDA